MLQALEIVDKGGSVVEPFEALEMSGIQFPGVISSVTFMSTLRRVEILRCCVALNYRV